jgi:hypothetical protein
MIYFLIWLVCFVGTAIIIALFGDELTLLDVGFSAVIGLIYFPTALLGLLLSFSLRLGTKLGKVVLWRRK